MKQFKKYKIMAVFEATRYDEKLSKEHEKRLRQINKEIKKLYQEQKELFANEVQDEVE